MSTVDETQIELGQKYRDSITGFEGVATGRHEYIHGCTRITLENLHDGQVKREAFDAPALVEVESGTKFSSSKTGGPHWTPEPRS